MGDGRLAGPSWETVQRFLREEARANNRIEEFDAEVTTRDCVDHLKSIARGNPIEETEDIDRLARLVCAIGRAASVDQAMAMPLSWVLAALTGTAAETVEGGDHAVTLGELRKELEPFDFAAAANALPPRSDEFVARHSATPERIMNPAEARPEDFSQIPPEHRTESMSKTEAGRRLGMRPEIGTKKQRDDAARAAVTRMIKAGNLRAQRVSDRKWIFDSRQVPPLSDSQ